MAPAEMLMNRKLQTTLPSCSKQKANVKIKQKLKQLKYRQKFYYDRAAKLYPLVRDDVVRINSDENWSKKAIVMQEVAPRSSHTVKTDDGQIFRRNETGVTAAWSNGRAERQEKVAAIRRETYCMYSETKR
uniref:Uncharacterized protein n=1 Tax=Cyprinus carpio carpio TaxID=630221 RepID=A0A9J7YQF5_CYPCA